MAQWSRGMIRALGVRGSGARSRLQIPAEPAEPSFTVDLPRDYSCNIFFLYGRIRSRFDSWALPLSGVNTVVTYYKESHILMNNGSWIDVSKSGCYSTIYMLFWLMLGREL